MTRIDLWSVIAVLMLGIVLNKASADEPEWPVEFAVSLEKSTFQTISAGVILYNQGDTAGCYRLFEGSLLSLRPFLSDYPEYAKMIEVALASSKKLASPAEKAIELRKPLDQLLLASRKRPIKKPNSASLPETSVEARPTEPRPSSRPAPDRPEFPDPPVEFPDLEDLPKIDKPRRTPNALSTDPSTAPVVTSRKPSTEETKAATPKPSAGDSEKPAPDVAPAAPNDPTFWKRIGDTARMRTIVHDFLFKATNDPRVAFDRGGKYPLDDRTLLTIEHHILELLSSRTGGPLRYRGRPLKQIYANMSVTEDQFKAVVEDLEDVLIVHEVGVRERRELLDVVNRLKPEIVSPK